MKFLVGNREKCILEGQKRNKMLVAVINAILPTVQTFAIAEFVNREEGTYGGVLEEGFKFEKDAVTGRSSGQYEFL